MPSDQLLTAEEVARLLQVRTSWVYDAARRGAIPHVRLGRYVQFGVTQSLPGFVSVSADPPATPEARQPGSTQASDWKDSEMQAKCP